jgi:hypothetical protein
VTLDWDGVTRTAGSLSNSYDIDPAKAGNDIIVVVSGNTAQFQDELGSGNPISPTITTNFRDGLATAQNTLCLAVNFSNHSQFAIVTVDFSALSILDLHTVSFTLFDINNNNISGSTFTSTYGSGSGTVADPTCQHVGLHDITFTPIPEINPLWSAVGSCLLTAALILRHSAKFRK